MMRLQAIRSHFGPDGNVQAVGSEYEAPDAMARMLIAAGKATPAPAAVAAPSVGAPAAPAPKAGQAKPKPVAKPKSNPMTVASVPALVPGTPERTESCSPAQPPNP